MITDKDIPEWYFDETTHAGVDYADTSIAEEYDSQHSKFRNFEEEARRIVDVLGIGPEDTVLDMGCGTGAIALNIAGHCRKVIGVDTARSMLGICRKKAQELGISNMETHCAGFLTYVHKGEGVDAIVTKAALHHLPDFWKCIALERMAKILKSQGKLYLWDVVFGFDVKDHASLLQAWIDEMRKEAGPEMADEVAIHIRDEFSTYDWIMEGMLAKAGFTIKRKVSEATHCLTYICTKMVSAQ